MDMDSAYRINHNFAIYSDILGTIEVNDLNIYYATESYPNIPFKLPISDDPYVVYSNRNSINAVNSDIDSALYKYDLSKDNLYLPNDFSGDGFIDEDDKLYCPAQQYYLKAKITKANEGIIYVEFPFVPLYSLD
jgi:hypothetical protein